MRIVEAYPPLIEEIDAAFKVRGKPILYAWGDTIFNPLGVAVPPELVAHEKVHGRRQLAALVDPQSPQLAEAAIRVWWMRYIADADFRLREEIHAHVAEFLSLCEQHAARWVSQRNMRRAFAAAVARKLSAPLYGGLITFREARAALLAGAGGA